MITHQWLIRSVYWNASQHGNRYCFGFTMSFCLVKVFFEYVNWGLKSPFQSFLYCWHSFHKNDSLNLMAQWALQKEFQLSTCLHSPASSRLMIQKQSSPSISMIQVRELHRCSASEHTSCNNTLLPPSPGSQPAPSPPPSQKPVNLRTCKLPVPAHQSTSFLPVHTLQSTPVATTNPYSPFHGT